MTTSHSVSLESSRRPPQRNSAYASALTTIPVVKNNHTTSNNEILIATKLSRGEIYTDCVCSADTKTARKAHSFS